MIRKFTSLKEFVFYLESIGDLHRIQVEADPYLETTEVAIRALKENKPAILFENPKGAKFPLAMNILASEKRIEHALGVHPEELGEQLIKFIEVIFPPNFKILLKHSSMLFRFLRTIPKKSHGFSQDVIKDPDLSQLPIQKCWPGDGGKFITLGQVITYDPLSKKRNIGIYRMQVFDNVSTGMHWQIQKGGGFHYYQAQKLNQPLEVAVVIGSDPALLLASVAALPEGIDEFLFAGFLRNDRIRLTKAKTISIDVPSNAEFILEGKISPTESRLEGPFGDHFGHYSAASNFPVFRLNVITHRRDPIYPGTIVGKPPMEDKFLGNATQQILGSLIRLIHPEIKSLWAYYEAGFHNLLVISIEERYEKEAVKTALSVVGEGQLSLTKCVITVSADVNPRDWSAVLNEIKQNFDPKYDFVMIPKVPLDTLDFTSYKMNLGSKMIIDACKKRTRKYDTINIPKYNIKDVMQYLLNLNNRILDVNILQDTLLLVKVNSNIFGMETPEESIGKKIVEKIIIDPQFSDYKIIAVVSEDVNIHDQENYIWGIFTRFDCERDIIFKEQKLIGISPVYSGPMGIDATWKYGYPKPLLMDESIISLVDNKWNAYWKK